VGVDGVRGDRKVDARCKLGGVVEDGAQDLELPLRKIKRARDGTPRWLREQLRVEEHPARRASGPASRANRGGADIEHLTAEVIHPHGRLSRASFTLSLVPGVRLHILPFIRRRLLPRGSLFLPI